MKRLLFSGFAILATSLFVFSCSPAQPDLKSVLGSINEEVLQHSEAYVRLGESIQTIGHRLTGSENGAKAEEFVYNLLKSYGFEEVDFQSFKLDGWMRNSLDLEIGAGNDFVAMKSVALAMTPASAALEAEIIDMGNGLESDYLERGHLVSGKIVLAALNLLPDAPEGTRNIHRSSKAALAIRHGAKGIILFNRVPGGTLLTGTAAIGGEIIAIPAICIGLEDGMRLKNQVAHNTTVARIQMSNQVGEFQARNVIARIPGTTYPNEKIVVGGHLDSWDLSPGAVDNGIGAFSVIDMARTFKKLNLRPKRTIEFVLFMGEEQGLLGAKHYVEKADLDQIRYMLNFDMTNDPKQFFSSLEASKPLFEEIGAIVYQVDTGFRNEFVARVGLHSDHQPFLMQGIPIAGASGGRLSQQALDCYHADCDNFDLVDDQEMRNTVRYGAMLVYGLANAQTIDVRRLSDSEIKKLLQDNNLESSLRTSGSWRWD